MLKNESQNIFLVVPKLIEQSTWGGEYILSSKNWSDRNCFRDIRIGQSYELFSGSKLRSDINSSEDRTFTGELGYAMEPDKIMYEGDSSKLVSLEKISHKDPKGILGEKVLEIYGEKPGVLIKYTQATGNSFQIHVKEKDSKGKWHFKPEGFFYLEKGLLTLGTKKNCDWKEYEQLMILLEEKMRQLSERILRGEIKKEEAELFASNLIKEHDPWKFVNVIKTKKNEAVDLSEGGLHHSWEEDSDKYPVGNVVYEICYDVMDPISVLRCFDKCKFKPDGTLRKLDVKEYFKYVDRSETINDPTRHIIKPESILSDNSVTAESLLRTKYYNLDRLMLEKTEYEGKVTELKGSYHHLFLRSGRVIIKSTQSELELTSGHSCFIPNAVESYKIIVPTGKAEILKTFVS